MATTGIVFGALWIIGYVAAIFDDVERDPSGEIICLTQYRDGQRVGSVEGK